MFSRSVPIAFVKIIITVAFAAAFSKLCLEKPAAAIALSFVIMVGAFSWGLAKEVDLQKFILVFFFIYPLLPCMAGVRFGGLPAFKSHRLAMVALLFVLVNRGVFLTYYGDFLKSNVFTKQIFLIFFAYGISAYFSTAKGTTIFFAVSFMFETITLPAVVFSAFKTREDIDKLMKVLCWSAAVLVVLGIYEKITWNNVFFNFGVFDPALARGLAHQMRGGVIRTAGPFEHSISYGSFLAMSLVFFFYRYKENFIKFTLSMGGVFLAILGTQSRAALLGAMILVALYYIFVSKKHLNVLLLTIIPILILAVPLVIDKVQLTPSAEEQAEKESSSMARNNQVTYYMDFIKDDIVFGHGMSTLPAQMLQPNRYTTTIDNFYLLYLYFFGVFGLITFILMLVTAFVKPIMIFGVQILKDDLLPLILMSFIVFALVNYVVALWSFHFFFWIMVGIVARLIVNKRSEIYA
ncbi:MAG: O-antigen ligase family protein [bacterium]|nr:O-antigen ligase family protein [bacterium]